MRTPLLVEWFDRLPGHPGMEDGAIDPARMHAALLQFKREIGRHYSEGTLQRLAAGADVPTRRAAVLALGLLGSMDSNELLAARLHDDDDRVMRLASEALWKVWFRGDSEDNNQELQRLMRLGDRRKLLVGLNELIDRAPTFAEAYNQRAILFYQVKRFELAVSDCEMVLALNPVHFGAQSGMGQCLMQLGKHRAALRAFRAALRIHPGLEGVAETIRVLESGLGED